jgi:hypothetical protein
MDRQPTLPGQELTNVGHHPFPCTSAANVDVTVVRVAAKVVPAASQFPVEIVQQ